MSRGSSSSSSPSKHKNGANAPETHAAEPPLEQGDPVERLNRELELTPDNATPVPAHKNPYHFVAYWQDANEERDFGIRFEPEDGAREFVRAEVERLEIQAAPADIQRAVLSSLEAFRSTYSKRTGRHRKGTRAKTRGSQLHPETLTEELVAWLRTDLARFAARPRAPARGLKSVDEAIDQSMKRARKIDSRKGGSNWQTRKQSRRRSPG